MTREQAIHRLISSGFTENQVSEIVRALTYESTTKNNLEVDYRSLEDIKKLVERKADELDGVMLDAGGVIIGLYFAIANDLPSVTPQEPRKGHLSIDDVMSVFDDFMCGEVDENGTETFLEMLKDKADMREVEE